MNSEFPVSNEQITSFVDLLKNNLPEHRDNRGKRHTLVLVIVGFVCATLIGAPPRGSPKDFGTPVAKIDSPRGKLIMPQSALRPDQLRTKAASLTLPQMALRLFEIKFLAPERTYSSLQIAKFPFAYYGLKIIPDFQR